MLCLNIRCQGGMCRCDLKDISSKVYEYVGIGIFICFNGRHISDRLYEQLIDRINE